MRMAGRLFCHLRRLPRQRRAEAASPDIPWDVRPDRPHPLFYGFVKASVEKAENAG